MKITDKIYGQFEINEPVLLELINSKAVQRLKGIAQYGMDDPSYPFPGFSRYDHSVGIMLLLEKLKAPIEEKIAALLHDISHSAFSHCVDFIFDRFENEDHHEHIQNGFLNSSDASQILKKYNYDIDKFSDALNFPILKKEIPSLCADVFDYAVREFKLWANPDIVEKCLENITIANNQLVFTDLKAARSFADTFLRLQTEHWGSKKAVSRYFRIADLLKVALEKKIISEADLYINDEHVIKKINQSEDKELAKKLKDIKSMKLSGQLGIKINKKFRYVDPEVIVNNKIKPLTLLDKDFTNNLQYHRELNQKGIKI